VWGEFTADYRPSAPRRSEHRPARYVPDCLAFSSRQTGAASLHTARYTPSELRRKTKRVVGGGWVSARGKPGGGAAMRRAVTCCCSSIARSDGEAPRCTPR
jgi:hypothetical protein